MSPRLVFGSLLYIVISKGWTKGSSRYVLKFVAQPLRVSVEFGEFDDFIASSSGDVVETAVHSRQGYQDLTVNKSRDIEPDVVWCPLHGPLHRGSGVEALSTNDSRQVPHTEKHGHL
jgi:hypothetical protein